MDTTFFDGHDELYTIQNLEKIVLRAPADEQVVHTKSPTGSKFSKILFQLLYTGWTVLVHLYCGFSLWRQMAPQQSAKFTIVFGQFRASLRKDSVANYASIRTLFSTSVTGPDVLCNALNISQIRLLVAPQDSKKLRSRFCKE